MCKPGDNKKKKRKKIYIQMYNNTSLNFRAKNEFVF